MNKQQVATDPKEELVSLITDEMNRIKAKLIEIKAQIDQTQLTVQREEDRYRDIAIDLRTVQDNLDTMPRQDIKDKYDEALKVVQRSITMRGQLEKSLLTRESLERDQVLFSQFLQKLQGVEVLPDSADAGPGGAGKASTNIVRIVQAEEVERQRLARQMHDGPAQSLTNFILQAEICQRLFDRNPERAAEELNNLKTQASSTFQKVRDFIFDLRPMMLDDLGVVPTVRRFVDSFKEKNDIETSLELHGDERRLPSHLEVMIFRGVQELMGHARDYASAARLTVRLDIQNDRVKINVEDNGRGFNADAIFSGEDVHSDPRAQDLITLKEKFELVGGSMAVNSSETEGTSVRLELPVVD
jgi:two-component system, NarL family, sensor histidine kinase DegS